MRGEKTVAESGNIRVLRVEPRLRILFQVSNVGSSVRGGPKNVASEIDFSFPARLFRSLPTDGAVGGATLPGDMTYVTTG